MKLQTVALLAKAHEDLQDAQVIAAAGREKVAARCAYYAAFHAAEALIRERTGGAPKTHSGVHSEFARLIKESGATGLSLHAFLTRAYKHKQVSDYGPVESDEPSMKESVAAVAMAVEFVEQIEALLSVG